MNKRIIVDFLRTQKSKDRLADTMQLGINCREYLGMLIIDEKEYRNIAETTAKDILAEVCAKLQSEKHEQVFSR